MRMDKTNLEGADGRALEAEIRLEILSDLTDETLEWKLSDQEFGRFLVSTNLTKSNGTWLVPMWLLDTSGGWGRLSGNLGSKLLTRSLSSSRFTGGLLGSGHCDGFVAVGG